MHNDMSLPGEEHSKFLLRIHVHVEPKLLYICVVSLCTARKSSTEGLCRAVCMQGDSKKFQCWLWRGEKKRGAHRNLLCL